MILIYKNPRGKRFTTFTVHSAEARTKKEVDKLNILLSWNCWLESIEFTSCRHARGWTRRHDDGKCIKNAVRNYYANCVVRCHEDELTEIKKCHSSYFSCRITESSFYIITKILFVNKQKSSTQLFWWKKKSFKFCI